MLFRLVTCSALVVAAAGCAPDEPRLMQAASITSGTGPDEFAITTNKPLEEPESYANLPQPTPLGTNLADVDPQMDIARALGGRVSRTTNAAPSSALLAHASRFGFVPGIRAQLAQEDLEFRRNNRGKLMERWFGTNVYFDSYASMTLDRYGELDRLRSFGIATPAAPPLIN